jgi:hypothetical protein
MLKKIAKVPVIKKKPITGFRSTLDRELINKLPIPLQAKTRSVMTAPPITAAKSKATKVVSGIKAFLNA